MSKKIVFLITFMIVSIFNTIQPMFFAFAIAAVNEDDESCCNEYILPVFSVLATLFQSEKKQSSDQLPACLQVPFDQQREKKQEMISQQLTNLYSKKID